MTLHLPSFETTSHVITVVVVVALFLFVFASAVGTFLAEMRRSYRLPYEPEYPRSNVRLIHRDDEG